MTRNAYYVLSSEFGRKVKHAALYASNMLLFTPQAVRKRHFEAYHSWQSRYCDST